ncbi:OmpA family protein [Salidesulfovibrio brasiliensis]|uniref:OmpA family protein n=1 Tax=Salidesulfovibrio brasiliensis TaxID=221711 RepID=UPI0006CF4CF1|nr:OmpA family protein [Salidesulfovibrio brasiliensis]
MKQTRLFTLCLAMLLTLAMAAGVAHAEMVKKVDNFIIFVDQSGSMAQKHDTLGKTKIDLAKNAAAAMNKAIPELDYTGALFCFAPFEARIQPTAYNEAAFGKGIANLPDDFDIFNRNTPMGNGLMDIDPVISGMSGKTAVIMFTDGDSNYGSDPVMQAKALYAKYGANLCLHIVSLADTDHGRMVIDQIRALSGCSVNAEIPKFFEPAAMSSFVKDVFYEEVAAEPAPAPVEPAAMTISFDLHFGFDKYKITDEMIPVLEEVKMLLEENPSLKFEIAGHTDSTGTEAYNQGLSERRAGSVQTWLVENGISANRLTAVGYGELNPKYDNGTREGRRLNRRVDLLSK